MTNTTETATPTPAVGTAVRVRLSSGALSRHWWVIESIDADGIADLANWESSTVHRSARVSSLVEVA